MESDHTLPGRKRPGERKGQRGEFEVDILLPTCNRLSSLVMTLAGIAAQTCLERCRVIVADQSREDCRDSPVVTSLLRVIEARRAPVSWHRREERRGIAEQRHFLLEESRSPYVLFIDDDVFMESWVIQRLVETIREQECAFVGAFPTGLSFRRDERPQQQIIEYWEGPVEPEEVEPDSPRWERAQLHRAANAYHVAARLEPGETRLYKVAWVACCILYEREKLNTVGGFSFWPRLPRFHAGEEVLVQNLLMRLWGGCAILPSGTYHSEMPSTVLNEQGRVDGHALVLLPEMIERYAPAALGIRQRSA
jgi:GT2 family glycosyltransferase